jgi:ubiquinol-cytochrome c reductase cytochrome b subunit
VIHIIFLHQTGSNNPLGIDSDSDRIPFHPYYSIKDLLGYSICLLPFFTLILLKPNIFTDPENFLNANPLITPIHIQPEWYFLWLYAILRSIPNKLGGVIALVIALVILFLPPFSRPNNKLSISVYPASQTLFWSIISSWLLLTWIGRCPVEAPYVIIGQAATILFFFYFIINPLLIIISDKLLSYRPACP